ncbi:LIC_10190 family membrane protein [candidate division CSSED10-310 bacterium]|uniref:LIC_10190 family membrane protein n=1 Tax=candidate division CSSED10-310 bacterium TaxID=2855610 RepID=A0ABV6Z032_UNCC1
MMIELITSLSGYFIIACTLEGWGSIPLFRASTQRQVSFFSSNIWLGWCYVLILAQLWHFFLPISWKTSLSVMVIGLCSFIFSKRKLLLTVTENGHGWGVFAMKMTVLVGLVSLITWRAMLSPTLYDSGLYHFTAIRWLNEYPLVPGLGNLHTRLAFNQSFFCYPALLNVYPYFMKGANVAVSSLLIFVLAESLHLCWLSISTGLKKIIYSRLFLQLFLPILLLTPLKWSLSSPAPDYASFLVQIILMYHFLKFLEAASDSREEGYEIHFIIIIALTLITLKLSNAAFSLVLVLSMVSGKIFKSRKVTLQAGKNFLSQLAYMVFLAGGIIIIWCARGAMISGYPLYPSSFAALDVDWKVPWYKITSDRRWIYSWARQPQKYPKEVLRSWQWLKPWLKRHKKSANVAYPFYIFCVALMINVVMIVVTGIRRKIWPDFSCWMGIIPCLAGIGFWFFTAPDPRFVGSLVWISSFLALLPLSFYLPLESIKYGTIILLLLSVIAGRDLYLTFPTFRFEKIREVSCKEFTTESGLTVYVPLNTDLCWDSPLPCSPYSKDSLHLRGHKITSGFRIIPVE